MCVLTSARGVGSPGPSGSFDPDPPGSAKGNSQVASKSYVQKSQFAEKTVKDKIVTGLTVLLLSYQACISDKLRQVEAS